MLNSEYIKAKVRALTGMDCEVYENDREFYVPVGHIANAKRQPVGPLAREMAEKITPAQADGDRLVFPKPQPVNHGTDLDNWKTGHGFEYMGHDDTDDYPF